MGDKWNVFHRPRLISDFFMLLVSDSVPNSFDTREHFDYNIANLTSTVINCSISSSCNDRSDH